MPNDLWPIDLIEKEPAAIGNEYGVPILDEKRHIKVPDEYIGYSVWVANFFDQYIEIRSGTRPIEHF